MSCGLVQRIRKIKSLSVSADLMKELPTYFEAIDRSLDRIGNATDELRDQFLSMDNLSGAGTACDNESDGVFEGGTTIVARSTDQLAKIVVGRDCNCFIFEF